MSIFFINLLVLYLLIKNFNGLKSIFFSGYSELIIITVFYPSNPSYSDVNHFSLIIVGGPTRGVRDLRAFSFVRLAALTLGSEELFEEAGKSDQP